MTLGELITYLEGQDQTKIVPLGFHHPHSYRGYYDQLAFEPAANVQCSEMLESAKKALGNTYTGYKGGEFLMDEYTEVWIADYGNTGDGVSEMLLRYMFNDF